MQKKNFYFTLPFLLFICLPYVSYAQEGPFINLHGGAQGGLKTITTDKDFEGKSYLTNVETTNGWGGGLMLGFQLSPRFGIYMNADLVGQKGSWDQVKDVDASTFVFDLGGRMPFTTGGNLIPYGLVNGGYYEISFTYGTPTIYIGPGGGGYSSGVDNIGGVHASLGVGLQISEMWDIQLLATRVKLQDSDAVTMVRLNAGFTLWFAGLD